MYTFAAMKTGMNTFILRAGETQEYDDGQGNIYHITVDEFAIHDHKQKPVYHPLNGDEKPSKLIVTVECSTDAHPSPYASCLDKYWGVLRKYVMFDFDLFSNSKSTFVQCHVRANPIGGKKIFGDPKKW